jgi:hypothetical protein
MTWFRWVALAFVVTLATACGDSSGDTSTGVLDGPVMRYPESASNNEGEDAEVRGRLELDADDCLYVALDDAGERYPVVWPAGTTWDAESESVISPSGARMPVGSEVYGGGGYHYVDDVGRSLGADAEERAARCVDNTYGEIAFVNNGDDGIGPAE